MLILSVSSVKVFHTQLWHFWKPINIWPHHRLTMSSSTPTLILTLTPTLTLYITKSWISAFYFNWTFFFNTSPYLGRECEYYLWFFFHSDTSTKNSCRSWICRVMITNVRYYCHRSLLWWNPSNRGRGHLSLAAAECLMVLPPQKYWTGRSQLADGSFGMS